MTEEIRMIHEENYVAFIIGADLFCSDFKESEYLATDEWANLCRMLAKKFFAELWDDDNTVSLYDNVCHFAEVHSDMIEKAIKNYEYYWKLYENLKKAYGDEVEY